METKLPSLAVIQNDLINLTTQLDQIHYEGKDIPAELEEAMSNLLFAESEKIASCCSWFDSVEKEIELADLQMIKLREYKNQIERQRDAVLNVAKKAMLARGLKSLDGDMGRKISLRRSEQVIVEVDPIVLPKEFVKHKIEADKTMIKDALKKGIEVEGCFIKENQNVNWR